MRDIGVVGLRAIVAFRRPNLVAETALVTGIAMILIRILLELACRIKGKSGFFVSSVDKRVCVRGGHISMQCNGVWVAIYGVSCVVEQTQNLKQTFRAREALNILCLV